MAHYAYINENNKVVQIFVGRDEDDLDSLPEGFSSWEEYQENFKGMKCRRYSRNTHNGVHYTEDENLVPQVSADQSKAFRGNCAAKDMNWSDEHEIFYTDSPHDSWTLNTTTGAWEPPLPFPDDGNDYSWNEELYNTDNTKGWVLFPETRV